MILVTGADGFIGRHVVAELVRQRRSVRAMTHRTVVGKALEEPDVEVVAGDVRDARSLLAACGGVDAIIHLVAVIQERPGATYETVNVLGTRNLVTAASLLAVRRFIHVSVLGASRQSPYRFTQSRWQAEEDVRRSSLDWTIFRPSIVFGVGSRFFAQLEQLIRLSPVVPVVGSGRSRFQPIWVEDLARCLVMAVDDLTLVGKTIEIGGPAYVTLEEMIDMVAAAAGLPRRKVHLPVPLLSLGASLLERLWPSAPITADQIGLLATDNAVSLDVVEREFGFKPAALGAHVAQIVAAD